MLLVSLVHDFRNMGPHSQTINSSNTMRELAKKSKKPERVVKQSIFPPYMHASFLYTRQRKRVKERPIRSLSCDLYEA